VYGFVRAAITKHHMLSGLNHRNVLSYNSDSLKFKTKVSVMLVPSEGYEEPVSCTSSRFWVVGNL
jgi:hypothetical protein